MAESLRPLGIALPAAFDEPAKVGIDDALSAGFSAVALTWNADDPEALTEEAAYARRLGLTVPSVHGPFFPRPGIPGGINAVWEEGPFGDAFCAVLAAALTDTARAEIPVMVLHPNCGYYPGRVSELALTRFARVGALAKRLGVRLAVENMEMPDLFEAMVDGIDPEVFGVCWDSGHNFAYTPDYDPLARYPGRIRTVHLHDNDGKTKEGPPSTTDDAHFLPFDGCLPWESRMRDLLAAGYEGPLVLEVKRGRAPCRNIPAYREMGQKKFFAEAYRRAEMLLERMKP